MPTGRIRYRRRSVELTHVDSQQTRQIQIMGRKQYESESSAHYNSNIWTNTESEQRDDIVNDPVSQRIIKICGI